jgi:penicillin-binding protein 1A
MKKTAKNIKDLLKPSIKLPANLKKSIALPKETLKSGPRKHATQQRRQDIRLHQHLLERFNIKREKRLRAKAEYLATLPKGRLKRTLYRLHPRRVAKFVFSRDGLVFGLRTAGIVALLGFVGAFVIFAYYRKDLPKNITDLKACSEGQKTSYYDRTGEVLLWRGDGDIDCRPVAIDQISPFLKQAVIAAEDKTFYKNPGFDIKGLINAVITNSDGKSQGRGGSTITQQYVKQALLQNNERRISRKVKELILSIELERSYKKDEIFQAYLNEISFGGAYNGAEAASQGFFNKSAKDLTLDEAAIFAAAIQAPTTYWQNNQEGLVARRNNYVLEAMANQGFVSRADADAAKKVDTLAKVVTTKNKYKDIKAPHFVIETQSQLQAEFGETNIGKQGYKVITTLDMTKQKFAEDAVAENVPSNESRNFDNAAIVSEDVATGQILAYVGSRDFNYPEYGQKNIAGTPRSPGSSVKAYDYAALMKSSENWGAGSIMYDWKTQLPGWPVNEPLTDFNNNPGNGPSSIRYLLGNSKNITAAKAVYIAGIPATQELARKLGVKDGYINCNYAGNPIPCDTVLATSIGDGAEMRLDQHVHGYSSLSRGGKYIPQLYVLKILDSKGKVIRDNTKEPLAEQVLDPQIAYIISDILSDQRASYFRGSPSYRYRVLGDYDDATIPTAIKTGTTSNAENGWMMGYTPKYATGVWVGNHENKSLETNNMEYLSGPIWSSYMKKVADAEPVPERWAKPEGIKTVTHDGAFFSLVKGACRESTSCGYSSTDIYPSWYVPKKTSNTKQKAVIDTVSGKRATDCTPERARKEVVSGGIIIPELDPADEYYKRFMDPITARLRSGTGDIIPAEGQNDDVHACSDVKPSVTISGPATCNGTCTIVANLTRGTKGLKNVYFKLDGAVMAGGAFDVSPSATSQPMTIEPDYSGAHTVSVEVVDDGLYDATASTSITFTSVPFSLDSAVVSGANVKFTWDDIGASSYSIAFSGASSGSVSVSCTQVASKCTANVPKSSFGASGTFNYTVNSSAPSRSSTSKSLTY